MLAPLHNPQARSQDCYTPSRRSPLGCIGYIAMYNQWKCERHAYAYSAPTNFLSLRDAEHENELKGVPEVTLVQCTPITTGHLRYDYPAGLSSRDMRFPRT